MLRAAVVLLVVVQAAEAYRSVCYYTNWSQYRNGKGKFVPEDLDPHLCTHVIYAFAKIVNNDLKAFEWNDESTAWSTGMYQRMLDLKKVNPNLKVMLGTGGWNMGSAPFHAIAATDATRKLFAQNLVKFLRDHGFDGWDNDWEYPGSRGSPPDDKMNNVLLMREIRRAFDADAAATGRPRLELSEAIGIGKATMDAGYDVPALSQVVDFFNLMTYDIHGSFDGKTGHNAPLYPDPQREQGDQLHYNVDWCIQTLAAKGMPRDKMNLGIPTYGRSFTLNNPGNDGPDSPGRAGKEGQYTREKGFISYYEICDMIKSGATVHSLAAQHAQYIVQGDQWIGFDDIASVQEKACYARQQGIGGVMYWALDTDDFKGSTCGQGKFPLIHAGNTEFQNPSQQQCRSSVPAATQAPNTFIPVGPVATQAPYRPTQAPYVTPGPTYRPPITLGPTYRPPTHGPPGAYIPINPPTSGPGATAYPATSNPFSFTLATGRPQQTYTQQPYVPTATSQLHNGQGYDCRGKINDFYVDPASCSSFYICVSQQAFKVECARGLLFNPVAGHCDWATNVNCGYNTQPPMLLTNAPVTNAPVSYKPYVPPSGAPYKPVTSAPYNPVTNAPYNPVTNAPYNPVTNAPYNPVTNAPYNPATQSPSSQTTGITCSKNQSGIFRHPSDCRKYIQCSSGIQFTMTCPNKLLFNPNMGSCDFPVNVPQCLTG